MRHDRLVLIGTVAGVPSAFAAAYFLEEIGHALDAYFQDSSAPMQAASTPAPVFPTNETSSPYNPTLPSLPVGKVQEQINFDQQVLRARALDVYGMDRPCFDALMADINRLQLELESKYQFYQRAGLLSTSKAHRDIQATIDEIDAKMQAAKRLVDTPGIGNNRDFCA